MTRGRNCRGGVRLEAIGGLGGPENNICLPVLPNPHDPNLAVVPFRAIHAVDAASKTVTSWTCCGGRMAGSPGLQTIRRGYTSRPGCLRPVS